MTEMKTEEHAKEERNLCRVGSRTERPCWREVTHKRWEDEAEPTVCAEHADLSKLIDDRDALLMDIDALEEWMKKVETHSGEMERLRFKMLDALRAECAWLAIEVLAAKLVADQAPPESGEPQISGEQGLELARRLVRSDAFNNARAVLEDLSEDEAPVDRWAMVGVVAAAAETAHEEFNSYKREIGFRSRRETAQPESDVEQVRA